MSTYPRSIGIIPMESCIELINPNSRRARRAKKFRPNKLSDHRDTADVMIRSYNKL